jgi:hypothetical protein
MLTKDQIIEQIRNGKESECIDGRDFCRLAVFFSEDELPLLEVELKEGESHEPVQYTEESVLTWLEKDLDFAFEKALDQRGLSASSMYEVVKMWLWILEDDLQHFEEYAQYGLPLLKAVAVKYNLPNPIGNDTGSEAKYAD